MPELKDLYTNFQNKTSGASALGNALSNPMQTLGGIASGIGGVVRGVGGLAMDIPQAFMPQGVKLPWSSGAIVPEGTNNPIYSNPSAAPGDLTQRFAKITNALGLGIPTQLADNYGKSGSIDDAVIDTARNLLPIKEISALLTGESPTNPGSELTPEEVGKNSFDALLKSIPLVKGIRGAKNMVQRGTTDVLPQRTAKSVAELENLGAVDEAAAESRMATLARNKQLRDDLANLPKDALPETAVNLGKQLSENTAELLTQSGFTPEVTGQLMSKVPIEVLSGAMFKELMDFKAGTSPTLRRVSSHAIELLGTNPTAVDSVVQMMQKYNMTPEQTAASMPIILEGLQNGATNSGKIMKIYSEMSQLVTAKLLHDNPEAASHMSKVLKAMDYTDSPISQWDKFKNVYSKVEQIWRGAAVSSPVTAARNTTVGLTNFTSQLFDSAMMGAEAYAAGKVFKATGSLAAEEAPSIVQAFEPLMSKIRTMQELAFGGAKTPKQWWDYMQATPEEAKMFSPVAKIIDEVGKQWPQEILRLMNGPVQDLATVDIVGGGFKKALPNIQKAYGEVETLHDAAKFTTSLLNTFNTMQEMFWRKFYFTSRLRANVKRFGFDTPEEYMASLKDKKADVAQYFGETHNLESLAELQSSGKFDRAIARLKDSRTDNYTAQKGVGLHSVEKEIIDSQHLSNAEIVRASMKKLESDLKSGISFEEASRTIDPQLARVLGGKLEQRSTALTEAVDYGLKQTFAFTPPKGHFGYSMMKLYEEFPMLYTLATPFPRFMLNSTQWILEHDPSKLQMIAHPEFMKTLARTAADPTKIGNAKFMDQFSQAHTGAALWAASYAIHTSDMSGPKYYQMKVGVDQDNNDMFVDLRPYNPLVQYMFIDHTMRAVAQGQTPNLTAGELTEALLGLRRLGEVPIFALPDIIRQIDSSNPDAFFNSLKPLAGQYMAGALTPFRLVGDLAGAAGVQKAVEYKDVGGNELLGPAINQLPIAREALPARVDPFTGKPSGVEHPAVRLLGPNIHHATKLEQEVSKTGMPLNDLLGNYADPEADRLVRKNIGAILNTRLDNGQTLANVLGEGVQRATADQPIEVKKTMLRELYKQIRDQAKQQAMAENPYAFIEHEIRQRPESERPVLRKGLEFLNQKRVELMQR